MSTQQLKQKGFTIIEVVLVLAIAALIFLMVFIALPALQRNQRDTARKTVLGKVSSAVTTFQSNKRGAQPANGMDLAGYVDGKEAGSDSGTNHKYSSTRNDALVDNDYIVTVTNTLPGNGKGNADTNVIQVITGAKCDDSGSLAVKGSSRNAAILIELENGEAVVCQAV